MMRKKQKATIAYNPQTKRGERWIEHASDGLRIVGAVHDIKPDWRTLVDHTGWHLDPWGDGETVHGSVLRLPSRAGVAQYVPAVSDPYNDDAYLCDFGSVTDCLRTAIYAADRMAESYAEKELEYQTEQAALMRIEEAREEIKTARAEHSALSVELRAASVATRHDIAAPAICAAVHDKLEALRERVRDCIKEIRKLTDEPWTICER